MIKDAFAMPGEIFDSSSDPSAGENGARPESARRFVGIQFSCCSVYSRVYVNQQGTGYEGNCPKCGRRVRLRIGPDGTNKRFFTAY